MHPPGRGLPAGLLLLAPLDFLLLPTVVQLDERRHGVAPGGVLQPRFGAVLVLEHPLAAELPHRADLAVVDGHRIRSVGVPLPDQGPAEGLGLPPGLLLPLLPLSFGVEAFALYLVELGPAVRHGAQREHQAALDVRAFAGAPDVPVLPLLEGLELGVDGCVVQVAACLLTDRGGRRLLSVLGGRRFGLGRVGAAPGVPLLLGESLDETARRHRDGVPQVVVFPLLPVVVPLQALVGHQRAALLAGRRGGVASVGPVVRGEAAFPVGRVLGVKAHQVAVCDVPRVVERAPLGPSPCG